MAWQGFVALHSPAKAGLLTIASMGFVAMGLMMIGTFGADPTNFQYHFGWLVIVFFSVTALGWAVRLLSGHVAIRINGEGIYDGWLERTIPWDAIRTTQFKVQRTRTRSGLFRTKIENRFILYDIDPDFDLKLPRWKVWMQDWSFGMTSHSNSVSAIGTERTFEEIARAFDRYAPEHLQLGEIPKRNSFGLEL